MQTPCEQTDRCKSITLPQTSFAGGNKCFNNFGSSFGTYEKVLFPVEDSGKLDFLKMLTACYPADHCLVTFSSEFQFHLQLSLGFTSLTTRYNQYPLVNPASLQSISVDCVYQETMGFKVG